LDEKVAIPNNFFLSQITENNTDDFRYSGTGTKKAIEQKVDKQD
jgi:hypothetical protein